MLPVVQTPVFDRKGPSRFDHEQQVRLPRQVTSLGSAKRAAALILRIDLVARRARSAAGSDIIANFDGAGRILAALRGYFALGAVDSIYRGVVR